MIVTSRHAPAAPACSRPLMSRPSRSADWGSSVVSLLALLVGLFASSAASDARADTGVCSGGCEAASRHPFDGFWIANSLGSLSEWFEGGDVGAAFARHMTNMNLSYHSQSSCVHDWTITSITPTGSAPLAETGGPWRSVHANQVSVLAGELSCFGTVPGVYHGSASISGMCGDSLNINNIATGTDDACYCKTGFQWSGAVHACLRYRDRFHDKSSCSAQGPGFGKPIYPLSGSERMSVDLGSGIQLVYNTRRMVPSASPLMRFSESAPPSFGALWESSLHKRLVIQSSSDASGASVNAARGSGGWVSFTRDPNNSGVFLPARR